MANAREQDREDDGNGGVKDGPGEERPQGLIATPLSVASVSCGNRHAALVCADGSLHTFGHGECGRLGHGHEDSYDGPALVEHLRNEGIQIEKVSCGRDHTVAISDQGCMYSCGWGEAGRLGLGIEATKVLVPTHAATRLSAAGEKFVDVSCGAEHTLLVGTTGKCYVCGTGQHLGLRVATVALQPEPVLGELANMRIVGVGAGLAHSAAVSSCGKVYTWGFGQSGALGHGNLDSHAEPVRVRDIGWHCNAFTPR